MKRRRTARFINAAIVAGHAIGIAICATPSPASAQGASWGGPFVPPTAQANDPAVQAAQKEVRAFRAAFAKMEKEKGWAAASRFFLTPDYKETDRNGITRTKDEHIRRWADTYARINKEMAAFALPAGPEAQPPLKDFYETVEATNQKNAVVVTTRVGVPEVRSALISPNYAGGASVNGVSRRRILNMVRRVFRRTPDGLRLEREAVTVQPYRVRISEAGEVVSREP